MGCTAYSSGGSGGAVMGNGAVENVIVNRNVCIYGGIKDVERETRGSFKKSLRITNLG